MPTKKSSDFAYRIAVSGGATLALTCLVAMILTFQVF
jgi:hypothetical protein